MRTSKRLTTYWILKVLSIVVACALPIWGILEQFPIWKTSNGTNRAVGAGMILIAAVILIVFRRAVFKFFSEKLKLTHAPPLMIWLCLILLTWCIMWLSSIMEDMMNIYILGFIGCLIGNVLTFIGEHLREDETEND